MDKLTPFDTRVIEEFRAVQVMEENIRVRSVPPRSPAPPSAFEDLAAPTVTKGQGESALEQLSASRAGTSDTQLAIEEARGPAK